MLCVSPNARVPGGGTTPRESLRTALPNLSLSMFYIYKTYGDADAAWRGRIVPLLSYTHFLVPGVRAQLPLPSNNIMKA